MLIVLQSCNQFGCGLGLGGMRKVRTKFSKDLGLLDSVLLGIGFIIGSGIFLFPIIMAGVAGTYSLVSWVVAGVYSILTGLCFAENAQRMHQVGGLYAYAHQTFGDAVGFLTGWAFWTGYWMTIVTETIGTSLYLGFFLPGLTSFQRVIIATVLALILTVVNYRGVRSGGTVEDAFTVGKLVPLLVFAAVGLLLISSQNHYPLLPSNASLLPAVGSATIFALWAYLGVEIITVPEEEIKNAKKTVPRAIIISVLTVMCIYLLVTFVALGLGRWSPYLNSHSPCRHFPGRHWLVYWKSRRDVDGRWGIDSDPRLSERGHSGSLPNILCDG
jgi:APA family basic amino acid/polyamine antiporter